MLSPKNTDPEEILLDADTNEELELEETEIVAATMNDKLKKLRAELKASQKERDENLAGWQRAKADMVNFRRTVEEHKERDGARARGKLVKALVPALDSLDTAVTSEQWQQVEKGWRDGIERITHQLHTALEAEGMERFGEIGDTFDPTMHDCISVVPTATKKNDHTLAQILQKGYRIGTEVIRPAKVTVHQHT